MQKVSSGIESLDRLIDYIYLGDNVVWEVDAGTSYEIFIKKFIDSFLRQKRDVVYVSFNKSIPTLIKELKRNINENFHIIDCFTSGKGKNDSTFLKAYEEFRKDFDIVKINNPSNLEELSGAIAHLENKISTPTAYVFDSLTGLQDLLKDENLTYSFFTYMCPRLFDVESVAYWILERDAHSQKFKANIRHVTQLVFELYTRKENFFIKALKLARRKNRDAFKPHIYEISADENIEISLLEQSHSIDIGSRLREIRISRNMSQKELAEKVNLTAGFISQMENNQIVPSISSFVQICEALGIKPGEVLSENSLKQEMVIKKEELTARSHQKFSKFNIYKIFSDDNFKAYYLKIPANCVSNGHFLTKKEPEIIFLVKGLITVKTHDFSYLLKEGDFLYLKKNLPERWENKGGDEAEILLISK